MPLTTPRSTPTQLRKVANDFNDKIGVISMTLCLTLRDHPPNYPDRSKTRELQLGISEHNCPQRYSISEQRFALHSPSPTRNSNANPCTCNSMDVDAKIRTSNQLMSDGASSSPVTIAITRRRSIVDSSPRFDSLASPLAPAPPAAARLPPPPSQERKLAHLAKCRAGRNNKGRIVCERWQMLLFVSYTNWHRSNSCNVHTKVSLYQTAILHG